MNSRCLIFCSGCQTEELVSSLQIPRGAEYYHRRGRAGDHGVCGRWLIVNLAVHSKWQLAVLG